MTQNELSEKGRELATKFFKEEPDQSGLDCYYFTLRMMAEFYEWLIQQGDLLTREDHLDQLREAEQDGYEEAQESAAYQRENMREEG